jgi:hypothetical protein
LADDILKKGVAKINSFDWKPEVVDMYIKLGSKWGGDSNFLRYKIGNCYLQANWNDSFFCHQRIIS